MAVTDPPPPLRNLDRPTLEALIELLFLSANADEEFSEEERSQFASNVADLTQRKLVGAEFKALMDRIEADVARDGQSARIAGLRSRIVEPVVRREVLGVAIQMVAADGVVRTSERDLLLEIADALEIDGDVAADMVRDLTRGTR